MKLKFKQQSFQNDAANAVCDVFIGQPYSSVNFVTDVEPVSQNNANIGYGNEIIKLDDKLILSNIQKVQNANQIELSDDVLPCDASNYNLTIEMETGVGKTYTYIKTIYELNRRYGWSKFIVVVPSVAIREGVYSSFSSMRDHFYEQYGKSINYFIYNSNKLDDIKHYVLNDIISVMIINSQAFNSTKSDARKIDMELDSFNSRKPISVLADSHPIMIIDEPQSVEGAKTKASLKKFNPLMILRYSATHKKDSIYNMVYRLDAIDACNKKLVKKISVKGIGITGNNAVSGYIYLSSINCSVDKNPTATLEFDYKTSSSTKKVTKEVNEGFNLYENSKELEEYKGITVTRIDKTTDSVEFSNGLILNVGEMTNKAAESDFRRVQIQETIKSHFDKEAILFEKGIKTLSLFFIDEVSKYRSSNDSSSQSNGEYAQIFEEEYELYKNELLKNASIKENYKNLITCVHIIFGLPKRIENNKIIIEDKNDMIKTIKDISKLKIDAVKFHQLDIVRGSDFENIYNLFDFPTLDEDFYIELISEVLGFTRENIIIARLTGDSLGETLIAPKWKKSKGEIINSIIKRMNEKNIKQGSLLK